MESRSALSLHALLFGVLLGCSSTQSASTAARPSNLDANAPDDAGAAIADAAPGTDGSATSVDSAADAGLDAIAVDGDAGPTNACEWGGAPGVCITVSSCAALADHTSYAGQCPGPAAIECCITTPNVADDPPIPAGYKLMLQASVTADMTTWAVAILNDPATYPMFSTATKTFGAQPVLARVEWHPPDFQNSVVHRGVTLYEPS